jgi:hypothetical protein
MRVWTFDGNLPMLRVAALVFSAWGLLSGCTGPPYSYSKAGSDVADFRQDSDACVQEPRMSWGASGSPMIVGASSDGNRDASKLYRMCMGARGWTAEAPR